MYISKKYDNLSSIDIIGKLFKCVELPWLIQFFLMFHNDKPVDWLLDHLISTKVCSLDKDSVSDNMCDRHLIKHIERNFYSDRNIAKWLKQSCGCIINLLSFNI